MWAKKSLLVTSLFMASAAASASAATVDLAFTGVGPGQVETVSITGQENTGQFNFNVTNPTGGANAVIPGATIATWCVELSQNVGPNNVPATYDVLGPGFGPFVSPLVNVPLLTAFFNQFYTPGFTQDQATAFQLDIWELEFDATTPHSLATGLFTVSGNDTAVQQGNTWLTAFNTATAGPWVLFQLHNDTLQDQIFAVQGGGAGQNPTPLPSGILGGMALLAGVGLCARFRRTSPA